MYYPYEGGTTKKIRYDDNEYEVYVPPVGYVPVFPKKEDGTTDYEDFENVTLEQRPILNSFKEAAQQKWERPEPPSNWKSLLKEEARLQEQNKNAFVRDAQKFRNKMWDMRLHGCWIMVCGEPVYLTGMHFYHLNRKFDFGYPDFRFVDIDIFYLLQWVIENPNCYGLMLATLRRFGKTAILGTFLTEYITRNANKYAGMQAQTKEDAKEQFELVVVYPWKWDYPFWRPKYDQSGTQKSEIYFKPTPKKGRNGADLEEGDEEALYSVVNYRDAGALAYDGRKLHRYGREESGKTDPSQCKIDDAWAVV